MARGRLLCQSIALDIEFNKMSMEAQFCFMRTIPHLDRDGLILGNPVALWAKVAPLMPDLMQKMESCIKEWTKAKLVLAYDSPYGAVLFFKGFTKNQINMHYSREAESMFPPPPGFYRNGKGIEPDPTSNTPDTPPTPNKNETPESTPEAQTENKNTTPAEVRQKSGATPAEVRRDSGLIEHNLTEQNTTKTTARAREPDAAGASGGSSGSSDWQAVVNAYESNIGTFTALSSDMVKAAVDDYGSTLVVDAIKEAVRQNVRKWAYVDGILQRWHANGRASPKRAKPKTGPQTVRIFNQYTGQIEERTLL